MSDSNANQAETPATADLTHETYCRLRDMIISGQLAAGYHLKQVHLARMLNISQTPVREAMKILEREGWVVGSFNQGKIVRTFSQKDLQDIYEVREMLDGLTARKAAASLESGQIAHLEKLAHLTDDWAVQGMPPPPTTREKVDMDFHMNLATFVGNRQVIDIFGRLINLEALLVARSAGEPNECLHIHIVQAVKSREPDWAETVARRHIREAYQKLIAHGSHLHRLSPDGRRHPMKPMTNK